MSNPINHPGGRHWDVPRRQPTKEIKEPRPFLTFKQLTSARPQEACWHCVMCGQVVNESTAELLGFMCDNGPCRDLLAPLFDKNGEQHSRFTNQSGMLPKEQ